MLRKLEKVNFSLKPFSRCCRKSTSPYYQNEMVQRNVNNSASKIARATKITMDEVCVTWSSIGKVMLKILK